MPDLTKSPEKKEYGDKGFLRRLTLATAWGEGLDGFDLGILSVVLISVAAELQISPIWAGLIGASSLIGIFLGAPIGGFLSDRFGRRLLFLVDICLFIVLGIAQAFVTEGWQLFVIRLLLGIAIGAEYSIGSSMLSEFVPSPRSRPPRRLHARVLVRRLPRRGGGRFRPREARRLGLALGARDRRHPGGHRAAAAHRATGVAALAHAAGPPRRGPDDHRPVPRRRRAHEGGELRRRQAQRAGRRLAAALRPGPAQAARSSPARSTSAWSRPTSRSSRSRRRCSRT